jgi:hypothetical protein
MRPHGAGANRAGCRRIGDVGELLGQRLSGADGGAVGQHHDAQVEVGDAQERGAGAEPKVPEWPIRTRPAASLFTLNPHP